MNVWVVEEVGGGGGGMRKLQRVFGQQHRPSLAHSSPEWNQANHR